MNFEDGSLFLGLLVLLAASGTFSASETAFFSLDGEGLTRSTPAVRKLMRRPRDLLITILLGNLIVNLLFFAFAHRAVDALGDVHLLVSWLGPLLAILLAGEILPKTLAMRAALPVARIAAVPMSFMVKATSPLRGTIRFFLELLLRLTGSNSADERRITPEVLAEVLENSAREGLIGEDEADLLAEIVELGGIRVREIMTPRVDMVALDLQDPDRDRDRAVRSAIDGLHTQVCVVDGSPDEVVGQIRVRDMLIHPERDLKQMIMPVKFVPEVADALKLLRSLREDRAEMAVVVDEWGGTAGIVTLEDVFEEIVGDLRIEGEPRAKPVVPLGEGAFRVAGSLSVRDWNEQFGLAFVPKEFETVGGFVTARLGRIPRVGEEVRVSNLIIAVAEVRGRRVLAVDMRAAPKKDESGADSAGGGA